MSLVPQDDDNRHDAIQAFNALPAPVKGAAMLAAGSAAFAVNHLLKRGLRRAIRFVARTATDSLLEPTDAAAESRAIEKVDTVRGKAHKLRAGMVRIGKTTFKRLPDGTVLEEGTVYTVQYVHSGDDPLIIRIKDES